jgi:hypothetical protein
VKEIGLFVGGVRKRLDIGVIIIGNSMDDVDDFTQLSIILVSVKKMHTFDENALCICGFKPTSSFMWDLHIAEAQATEVIAFYNTKKAIQNG